MSDFGNDRCAFAYLASVDKPCWGELLDCSDDCELVCLQCEGHLVASPWLGTSDEENLRRYVVKDAAA